MNACAGNNRTFWEELGKALGWLSSTRTRWIVRFRIFAGLSFFTIPLHNGFSFSNATAVIFGELNATFYARTTNVFPQVQKTRFTVELFPGEQWIIHSESDGDEVRSVSACDGTNIYTVFYPYASHRDVLVATIYPELYPALLPQGTTIPWLAFCSAAFINKQETQVPIPWIVAADFPEAHICKSLVDRFREPPFLPHRIQFIVDEERMSRAPTNHLLKVQGLSASDLSWRSINYADIFAPGQKCGEFVVLQATNIGDYRLPIRFVCNAYEPRDFNVRAISDRTQSAFYHRASFVGQVLSVSIANKMFSLPNLYDRADIADYRLSNKHLGIDVIAYAISDRQWPITITHRQHELLRAEEERRSRVPKKRDFRGPFLFLVVGGNVLFACALLARRHLRHIATREVR